MNCTLENLFTQILARIHLKLLYPIAAYVVVSNVGAHNYLYYVDCVE